MRDAELDSLPGVASMFAASHQWLILARPHLHRKEKDVVANVGSGMRTRRPGRRPIMCPSLVVGGRHHGIERRIAAEREARKGG